MKLAIFDIDGTLTDSTEVDDKCMEATFNHFLGPNVACDWEAVTHVTDSVIVKETVERVTGVPCSDELYEAMKAYFLACLQQEATTNPSSFERVPFCLEFIDLLQNEGVQIGLGTGSWRASAEIKLRAAGIPFEHFYFGHADLASSRAAIAAHVVAQAAAKTGQVPSQLCYFGDGSWDYRTMKQLDWPFIGVDVKKTGKLTQLGAKHVIEDYSTIQVADVFC